MKIIIPMSKDILPEGINNLFKSYLSGDNVHLKALAYFACSNINCEDSFISDSLDYINNLEMEDIDISSFYSEIFHIGLISFFEIFKEHISSIFGYIPEHLDFVDDRPINGMILEID